jgi:hypothetical protein
METSKLTLGLACAALALCLPCLAQNETKPSTSATYDDHLRQARALLKADQLPDALAEAQAAAKLDPEGYEAPAAAALILHAAKRPAQAKSAIAEALKLAPADKRDKLQEIAKLVGYSAELKATPSLDSGADAPAKLTGAARRQMDALLLIIEDADKAKLAEERKKLLREFLDKSEPFLKEHSSEISVWTLRAVAAMELNQARAGWEAGRQMIKLGAENSEDPRVRKVMAMLERRALLKDEPPAPTAVASPGIDGESSAGKGRGSSRPLASPEPSLEAVDDWSGLFGSGDVRSSLGSGKTH